MNFLRAVEYFSSLLHCATKYASFFIFIRGIPEGLYFRRFLRSIRLAGRFTRDFYQSKWLQVYPYYVIVRVSGYNSHPPNTDELKSLKKSLLFS